MTVSSREPGRRHRPLAHGSGALAHGCGALALAVIASCVCADDAGPATLAKICDGLPAARAPARTQGTVRIESPRFSGEFLGVLIARGEPLAIRMQLFPDIGGKILDLAATATAQDAVLPMTGAALHYPDGAADRLLAMFATTALELHARLEPDRIRCCERLGADAFRLELVPRFGAARCTLELRGRSRYFTLERDGVRWTAAATPAGDLRVAGTDFRLTAQIGATEAVTDLPEDIFVLPSR